MNRSRVLSDFSGRWSMERSIRHSDGTEVQFVGVTHWRTDGGGLLCCEKGQMLLPGQPPLQAERRYRWAEDLCVFFDDGRFFHQVPPEGGVAEHWCDPDHYRVQYDFNQWPVFTVVWQVKGPRKDYEMHTLYRRC